MKTLESLRRDKYRGHAATTTSYFNHVFAVKQPKKASELESLIDEYCTLSNAECTKNHSEGRQIVSKTNVTDVLGRSNSITDVKHIPSTTRRGTSDLTVVKDGKALYVEVKLKDRQSEAQKQWQKRVEGFGNTYVIVRNIDEFAEVFTEYFN